MITLEYELQSSVIILPTGVHHNEQMIIDHITIPTYRDIDLPSIFYE